MAALLALLSSSSTDDRQRETARAAVAGILVGHRLRGCVCVLRVANTGGYMSEEIEKPRRPTLRLHEDGGQPNEFDFNSFTGVQRAFVKIAESQTRIAEKQDQKSIVSTVTLIVTICGFIGGLGATVAAFSQMGIFSMQSGWMFEGKEEAKVEHAKIHERIDAMNTKLDDLPKRVAEEMRRKR